MIICPMCKKSMSESIAQCPRCKADLSILVDYVQDLEGGLVRAADQVCKGNLGEAVWAYLEVLEVDPDNAIARRQVDRVAAAVRQFDRVAVGRRWLSRLHRQARFRRWLSGWQQNLSGAIDWWRVATVGLLMVLAFLLGYFVAW
jgi:hypothetical protein